MTFKEAIEIVALEMGFTKDQIEASHQALNCQIPKRKEWLCYTIPAGKEEGWLESIRSGAMINQMEQFHSHFN